MSKRPDIYLTCRHGDVDTSQPMHRWVECHHVALEVAQSVQNHEAGFPPTPVCPRHADFARKQWDLHSIVPLVEEDTA